MIHKILKVVEQNKGKINKRYQLKAEECLELGNLCISGDTTLKVIILTYEYGYSQGVKACQVGMEREIK